MRSAIQLAVVLSCVAAAGLHAQSSVPATPPAQHKSVGMGIQGDENGVSVTVIAPGSAADKAGIKVGDRVISIAGTPIMEIEQEQLRAIADTAKSIKVVVSRAGKEMTFDVVPAVLAPPAGTPPR
jgi:S1-C subfamily serine protease